MMFHRDPKTAQIGKEILPFEMGYLPEFFQRKAEVELGNTPENRQKGLQALRKMIENDENFNGMTFDDDFLLRYLRCRKFNTSRAFSQLKAFINFRKKNINAFTNFRYEISLIAVERNCVVILPYRCQDGCVVIHIHLGNWEPEEFPVEEIKRMIVIFMLQGLRDPMTQVNGIKFIFDAESNVLRHIKHITPRNLSFIYYGVMEYLPGRVKGVHFVNLSFTVRLALTIMKVFMSAKMKSRFYIHDTPESLLNFFPASIVPKEYGGELEHHDMTKWLKDMMSPEKLATLGGGDYPVK